MSNLMQKNLFSSFDEEFESMQRSMNRFFNQVTGRLGHRNQEEDAFYPPSNLDETDTHYLVTVDIPGTDKEHIHVECQDNRLVVHGERYEETRSKTNGHLLTETWQGSFNRVITFPSSVLSEKIEASYENGVLRIAVPKAEASNPRRITIGDTTPKVFQKTLEHVSGKKGPKKWEKGKKAA